MRENQDWHWQRLAVPLSWLCGLDDCPAQGGLADAFGDRYLCRYNRLYSRIRDAVLDFGYGFSAENTPLWRDYQAFSLITLHRILEERTIPYWDTASTVHRILQNDSGAALSPGFLVSSLKPNRAFHESAHCVAHGVLERFQSDLRILIPDEKERFVVEGILAESFANLVELLGSTFDWKQISDTLFYCINSYATPNADAKGRLRKELERAGAERRFLVLYLAYIEANLTSGQPSEAVRERVSVAAGLSSEYEDTVKEMTAAAFGLSKAFRENTTPMYFGLLGYSKEYAAISESKWLGRSENSDFIAELAKSLFQIAFS